MSAALQAVPTFPPEISADFPDQRYFEAGTGERHITTRTEFWDTFAQARVYRTAGARTAELQLTLRSSAVRTRAEIEIDLEPAQLRDLAQRLLDAAADIEQNPAATPAGAAA